VNGSKVSLQGAWGHLAPWERQIEEELGGTRGGGKGPKGGGDFSTPVFNQSKKKNQEMLRDEGGTEWEKIRVMVVTGESGARIVHSLAPRGGGGNRGGVVGVTPIGPGAFSERKMGI